jgi:hypothetical protein
MRRVRRFLCRFNSANADSDEGDDDCGSDGAELAVVLVPALSLDGEEEEDRVVVGGGGSSGSLSESWGCNICRMSCLVTSDTACNATPPHPHHSIEAAAAAHEHNTNTNTNNAAAIERGGGIHCKPNKKTQTPNTKPKHQTQTQTTHRPTARPPARPTLRRPCLPYSGLSHRLCASTSSATPLTAPTRTPALSWPMSATSAYSTWSLMAPASRAWLWAVATSSQLCSAADTGAKCTSLHHARGCSSDCLCAAASDTRVGNGIEHGSADEDGVCCRLWGLAKVDVDTEGEGESVRPAAAAAAARRDGMRVVEAEACWLALRRGRLSAAAAAAAVVVAVVVVTRAVVGAGVGAAGDACAAAASEVDERDEEAVDRRLLLVPSPPPAAGPMLNPPPNAAEAQAEAELGLGLGLGLVVAAGVEKWEANRSMTVSTVSLARAYEAGVAVHAHRKHSTPNVSHACAIHHTIRHTVPYHTPHTAIDQPINTRARK